MNGFLFRQGRMRILRFAYGNGNRYNRGRRHSTLGHLSLEAFERHYQQEQLQQQRPMAA